jgi:HTH-type transcriptional regulator/antitoxin HipB
MHPKTKVTEDLAGRIGGMVRLERERLGLRQDELALTAGVSTRVIHQIENGKTTSRLDSLIPVLSALGLTVEVQARGDQQMEQGDGR